ncbi:uncharacterized protein LOC129916659 [Episyrphus balteatus]|uniref:uncharacterized protein LOC129916659 n=1 Tax=Episyrphus balteatus TaxID=286459 RepID=UPI002485378F|nr:uncharacterized protein LOC129916659 [Episyrphus balteatus]
MTCFYKLTVHFYETMGPNCERCIRERRLCSRDNCIYADGINSAVVAVNKMLPGPPIEVCENDTVIADVFNQLTEATTMHWHGIHMSETPDMDGAPFITQYPINPGESFRYKFTADRSGTIWYHSHSHWQRGLGAAGSMVIRQPRIFDVHADLYDYDLTEHTIMIQDIVYNYDFDKLSNILINGKGRNHVSGDEQDSRYEKFEVVRGNRYRFRVIFNGVFNCPIEFSIDNHRLLIISTDGNDIEPIVATSFFMTSAERFDFVLHADRYVQNYWVRVRGYTNCSIDNLYQGAILNYKGAYELNDQPKEELSYDYRLAGVKVNPIDRNDLKSKSLSITELRSVRPVEWYESTKFQTFYSSFGVFDRNGDVQMQIDNITYTMPGLSLLQSKDILDNSMFCNKTTLANAGRDCSIEACQCVNVLSFPAYSPIELIVVNYMGGTHPFHIHGYTFRVVGQGVLQENNVWRIEEYNRLGLLSRNDFFPVEKDSVQIPGFGYIIIRFLSNNPGYWMYHCHIENHSILGMMAVLQIGEPYEMKNSLRSTLKC